MKTCLYLSQEFAPQFCEGGLGLTSAGLTAALERNHGWHHVIILPFYPFLLDRSARLERLGRLPSITVGDHTSNPVIFELRTEQHPSRVLLVRSDEWYDRGGIYRGSEYERFPDAGDRAVFYGLCIREMVRLGFVTGNIVHGNDWQSGAALSFLRNTLSATREKRPRLLFNIHSAKHKGYIGKAGVRLLENHASCSDLLGHDVDRGVSLLQVGILAADRIVTGSPTYARDVMKELRRDGLRRLSDVWVEGIIAGIDTSVWDPGCAEETDLRYSRGDAMGGKAKSKRRLYERFGLSGSGVEPVFCVCGRLVQEKGVDLLLEGLMDIFKTGGARLVVMGNGVRSFVDQLRQIEREAAGHIKYFQEYSLGTARHLYAASDFSLMPSRVEPCGLNQMIAMRYGTLPIVSDTGGLRDTVVDYFEDPENGTGFILPQLTSFCLRATVLRLLDWFECQQDQVRRAISNAMSRDWSWTRSARKFDAIYEELSIHAGSGGL